MIKLSDKLPIEQIRKAIARLSPEERMLILEELEQDLYAKRLRKISDILRSKAKTTSFRKISQITRKVRQSLHGEKA